MESKQIEELIKLARQSLQNSYCPYSRFSVGCAVLCQDGSIYTGCNIENASYCGGICAERTALVKAISDGKRKFKALAVTSDQNEYCAPCGICRQFIVEFGKDIIVILPKLGSEDYKKFTIAELLPLSFGPDDLPKINDGK